MEMVEEEAALEAEVAEDEDLEAGATRLLFLMNSWVCSAVLRN